MNRAIKKDYYVDRLITNLPKALELGRLVRGAFIEDMAMIDYQVNSIIRDHCFNTKQYQDMNRLVEFSELFLNEKMMLAKKIDIMESILKNNYSHMLKQYPELVGKLRNLNTFRTYLAHGMTVAGNSFLDVNPESFTLVKYTKGKIEQKKFRLGYIAKMARDAEDVRMTLNDINVKIYS